MLNNEQIELWEEPLRAEAALLPLPPKQAQTQADALQILLVEDLLGDAILTRAALDATKIPYNLCTMRKGDEALSYLLGGQDLGKNPPDLLLLDLGLPGMDGFEVLDQLKAAHGKVRAIPIVILTGFESFEYLQKTHDLYILDYIQKPCDAEKLRQILLMKIRQDL